MSDLRFAGLSTSGLLTLAVVLSLSGCEQTTTTEYTTYGKLAASTEDSTSNSEATDSAPNDKGTLQSVTPAKTNGESNEQIATNTTDNTATQESAADSDLVSSPEAQENLLAFNKRNGPVEAPRPIGDESSNSTSTQSVSKKPEEKPTVPRVVKLLVADRTFKTEGPQDALRISYDDFDLLKILNMEPVTPDAPKLLPGWLRDLDGKRVRVRGFMYPPFQETGIPAFVLARDNQICCFGRNPKVYDLVKISMRKGVTTHYIQNRPFDVVGIFHVRPIVEDGELYRLYEIDDAIVFD